MRRTGAILLLTLACAWTPACGGGTLPPSALAACPNWPNPSGSIFPIKRVDPYYPRSAARQGIEGYVNIEAVIGRDGRVKSAKVATSQPSGVFDQSALRAFEEWRYCPLPVDAPDYPNPVRLRMAFSL